eukprot:m.119389 g.119389  ORF g.119389 m.119389 type:complete len:240 (+) comp37695_c0_seq17:108-827(+)
MWRAFLWGDSTQKAQLSTKSSAVRRFSGESKNSNRELLSQLSSFYNKIGEVQIDDVVRLTKGKMENVIGWFRLRRNTKLRVSLRERAIHGSLIHYLTHAKCTEVLFGVFTGQSSVEEETKSFDYSMWTFHSDHHPRQQFVPCKVNVINLGNTAKDAYSSSPLQVMSDAFRGVLSTFKGMDCVEEVTHLYEAILSKLQALSERVDESQEEISQLQGDIEKLHHAIEAKNTGLHPLLIDIP